MKVSFVMDIPGVDIGLVRLKDENPKREPIYMYRGHPDMVFDHVRCRTKKTRKTSEGEGELKRKIV